MTTMKAVRFTEYGGPEVLQYVDVEKPTPGAGQILLKIEAVGVNYADTMKRINQYLTPTKLPAILGGEVAGTIEEVGADVTHLKPGQRVLATVETDGYAQYAAISANAVFPIPAGLSSEKAVTLPVQGLTAYEILKVSGQLKAGETVLVHAAAGGVGIFSVQLAKLLGAGKVIATASTAAKLELAKSLGADHTINYVTDSDWPAQVRELTGGKGADIILEMVGGEVFNQNFKCLNYYGRVVVFGAASRELSTLTASQLMYRNNAVIGYWLVNTFRQPEVLAKHMQELTELVATGKVQLIVEHTFPLAQTAQAHALLEGRQTVGKVVLLPHADS